MPRPGPRPYECVRRAWHSDRHQPIRGSLIKEIFRIANEVHSLSTRKNREWQDKLPIVVLKAEEIIYSKANSEEEYRDLNTLWERVNDAIDTIIRRDKTEENGEFLHPCIEAALHLGCTPVRSSRSQRNESTRCYLKREAPVIPAPVPPSSSANLQRSQYLMLSGSKADHTHSNGIRNNGVPNELLIAPKDPALNDDKHVRGSSTRWSVYPLYYDKQVQTDGFYTTKRSISCSKLGELDASKNFSFPSSKRRVPNKDDEVECDLTLRLGSLVVPCVSVENNSPLVAENGSASRSGRKV